MDNAWRVENEIACRRIEFLENENRRLRTAIEENRESVSKEREEAKERGIVV